MITYLCVCIYKYIYLNTLNSLSAGDNVACNYDQFSVIDHFAFKGVGDRMHYIFVMYGSF